MFGLQDYGLCMDDSDVGFEAEKNRKNKIKPTWIQGENEKYVTYHSWAGRNASLMRKVRDCLQANFICLFNANLAPASMPWSPRFNQRI